MGVGLGDEHLCLSRCRPEGRRVKRSHKWAFKARFRPPPYSRCETGAPASRRNPGSGLLRAAARRRPSRGTSPASRHPVLSRNGRRRSSPRLVAALRPCCPGSGRRRELVPNVEDWSGICLRKPTTGGTRPSIGRKGFSTEDGAGGIAAARMILSLSLTHSVANQTEAVTTLRVH